MLCLSIFVFEVEAAFALCWFWLLSVESLKEPKTPKCFIYVSGTPVETQHADVAVAAANFHFMRLRFGMW